MCCQLLRPPIRGYSKLVKPNLLDLGSNELKKLTLLVQKLNLKVTPYPETPEGEPMWKLHLREARPDFSLPLLIVNVGPETSKTQLRLDGQEWLVIRMFIHLANVKLSVIILERDGEHAREYFSLTRQLPIIVL